MKINMKALRFLSVAVVAGVLIALVAVAGGCAPKTADTNSNTQAPTGDSSDAGGIVADFTWSANSECGTCHVVEQGSMDTTAATASVHFFNGVDCLQCHTDVAKLESAHEGVNTASRMPTKLKTALIGNDICLSCHESTHDDLAALAALTASSTVLSDKNATVVNPHDLPQNDDHNIIKCGSCHDMHSSEPIAQTSKKNCLNCHHEDVFECGTCHEI